MTDPRSGFILLFRIVSLDVRKHALKDFIVPMHVRELFDIASAGVGAESEKVLNCRGSLSATTLRDTRHLICP
jgi:hypothetical protein